jgi:hypothetical protein
MVGCMIAWAQAGCSKSMPFQQSCLSLQRSFSCIKINCPEGSGSRGGQQSRRLELHERGDSAF